MQLRIAKYSNGLRFNFLGWLFVYYDFNSQREFNSIMQWTMYGKMKDEDLKAIFACLKTVTPINNTVVRFTPGIAKI